MHTGRLFERASEFDLIHNNFDWKPLTYALATTAPPMITTIHGFSSPAILAAYYAGAGRSFYCSISDADRDPGLDYLATTYNGIDPDAFTFVDRAGDYLLFFARFHPEKGAHLAIEIAKRAGVRLKMAGIPHDEAYFRESVEPHIDGDAVQFLGHVRGKQRDELLGGALALVHMTTRPERFGLTLIEAMACGTPVLGAAMGSIPEIVVDGVTGYLCATVDDAVARVPAPGRTQPRGLSRARGYDVLDGTDDRPLYRRVSHGARVAHAGAGLTRAPRCAQTRLVGPPDGLYRRPAPRNASAVRAQRSGTARRLRGNRRRASNGMAPICSLL